MWTCNKCGEKFEDSFTVCWKCGTTSAGVEDPNFLNDTPENAGEENEPYPPLTPEEMEELATVAHFTWPYQAHSAKIELEAAGIPVYLADELTISMDLLLSNAIGGIKVQVRGQDAEEARDIIDAMDLRTALRPENQGDEEEEPPQQEVPVQVQVPREGVMPEEEFWKREDDRPPPKG